MSCVCHAAAGDVLVSEDVGTKIDDKEESVTGSRSTLPADEVEDKLDAAKGSRTSLPSAAEAEDNADGQAPEDTAKGSSSTLHSKTALDNSTEAPADEAKGSTTAVKEVGDSETKDPADTSEDMAAIPSLEGKADSLLAEEPNTTSQPADLNTDTDLTANMGDGSSQ